MPVITYLIALYLMSIVLRKRLKVYHCARVAAEPV